MAKFDRKKFREEQFKKASETIIVDKYEDFQGTKSELLFLKLGDFILLHRTKFLLGLLFVIFSVVSIVGYKEFNLYRVNSSTIEIEKVEKKVSNNFSLTTQNKIQEFESLLGKFSVKDAKLRIYKRLADLHVQAFELGKAAEYLEKSADLVKEPKEIKAYYYYVAGIYREQSKENNLAIENFTKASSFVSNSRETQSLTAWSFYHAGRLKLLAGNSESAIKDLNKVIDIDSENPDVAEVKKLATFLLLKVNKT